MRVINLLILVGILVSCTNNGVKEYYNNGNLKVSYHKKNNVYNGKYTMYYEEGGLKEVHIYDNGVKVDSSVYYYPKLDNKIEKVRYWSDNTNTCINYDKNEKKISTGTNSNKNFNLRIGKWSFLNKKGYDSIVEYKNINNESFANQIWIKNNVSNDTLLGRGNFFKVYIKDTIKVNEILRVRFYLQQPFYNYSSDIEVILPSIDDDLKEYFSNFYEIKKDTFFSLKNDKIPHPEIPKTVPINHYVEFGMKFKKRGNKNIRGILTEYIYKKDLKDKKSKRIERRLFFDEKIFVKE